jgi:hypothetical protein
MSQIKFCDICCIYVNEEDFEKHYNWCKEQREYLRSFKSKKSLNKRRII